MSRRAKLLLAALFLALLAIPVVYLFLTWSPAEPLTFRIVRDTGERYRAGHDTYVRVYDVEVRNTAVSAIHFTAEDITSQDLARIGAAEKSLYLMNQAIYRDSTGYFDFGTSTHDFAPPSARCIVPARSTQHVRLMVYEGKVAHLTRREHLLCYHWMSWTKSRLFTFQHWLRPKLPRRFQHWVSLPDMDETITRLDTTALSTPGH